MPGRPMPPAMRAIRSRSSSLLRAMASLTAAMTRSWSISTSSGSTALGSISTVRTSPAPVITTRTAPPPAVASSVVSFSSSWACAIWVCICCAILAIWPMFTACVHRYGDARQRTSGASTSSPPVMRSTPSSRSAWHRDRRRRRRPPAATLSGSSSTLRGDALDCPAAAEDGREELLDGRLRASSPSSRMKPRSSGKARVSRAPSSATGRHSLQERLDGRASRGR